MIGIIVQLLLSWLIIWMYERNNLRVLGFFPTKSRLRDFLVFFLIAVICCSSGFLLKMLFSDIRFKLNPQINFVLLLEGLWWNIKSVMFEELIFRGVLFYILIRKLGAVRAIVISAVAFGIYHWFSQGVFGHPLQMAITFFLTGTMGLILAFGYARTMSLYIPCAIHLGWNFTQGFVFSDGVIGNGILITSTGAAFRTDSYVHFFVAFLTPVLSVLLLNYYLIKKKRQVDTDVYAKLNDAKAIAR